MAGRVNNTFSVEDAHIMFRNFAGKETRFNQAGKRNFCVELTVAEADKLEAEGWNVKRREPREEGDPEFCYIQVSVNFDTIPPNIWLVTSHNKTRLDSQTVEILDYADIERVDLVVRPYNWEYNGKTGTRTGVKAYVKNMYVTIVEDEFDERYADIPDSSMSSIEDAD